MYVIFDSIPLTNARHTHISPQIIKRIQETAMDMDILFTTRLSVPLFQVIILLGLTSVATLFGKMRLALIITYLFTLYWGYFLNRDLLFDFMRDLDYFIFVYFGFGIIVAALASLGFMVHHS